MKIIFFFLSFFFLTPFYGQNLANLYDIILDVEVANIRYDIAPTNIFNRRISDEKAREKADLIISANVNGQKNETGPGENCNTGSLSMWDILIDSASSLHVNVEDYDKDIMNYNKNDEIASFQIEAKTLLEKENHTINNGGNILRIKIKKKLYSVQIGTFLFVAKEASKMAKCKLWWELGAKTVKAKKIKADGKIDWANALSFTGQKGGIFKLKIYIEDRQKVVATQELKFVFDIYEQQIETEYGRFVLELKTD